MEKLIFPVRLFVDDHNIDINGYAVMSLSHDVVMSLV